MWQVESQCSGAALWAVEGAAASDSDRSAHVGYPGGCAGAEKAGG